MSEQQDETWAKRAEHWRQAAPKGASNHDAPNQILIKYADIGEGKKCLDLASGAGEPAISIALAVGEAGSVVATDASAEMLEGARERAANMGIKNISFENTVMEDLPFEDNTFDAVTCRFGLMHASDPLTGLKEANRVLKSGGKAAFMVHGPADKNNQWTSMHKCVQSFLEVDDQARFHKHYRFSADGELIAMLQEAGFTNVLDELTVTTITQEIGKIFWEANLMRSLGSRVEGLDEAKMSALNEAIAESLAPFKKNGAYELLSSNRMAYGTV
ncbi:MAG: class I SAM-dependent methyltransferase [Rhodospirillaceae bacterium]|jgi:ubiquinone/menaquinone biosynthesis C-methylase UbiE|nr:class I SAM-dependent methyltransferase [Rhodospirillaceae bacterium]